MLLALIFRGVAFEFRCGARKPQSGGTAFGRLADRAFAQGVVARRLHPGVTVAAASPAGRSMADALLAGRGVAWWPAMRCSGATWLMMRTEGEVQEWARLARMLLLAVLGFIALVSIWTPLPASSIAARWFSLPNIVYLSPVPLITAGLAWACGGRDGAAARCRRSLAAWRCSCWATSGW